MSDISGIHLPCLTYIHQWQLRSLGAPHTHTHTHPSSLSGIGISLVILYILIIIHNIRNYYTVYIILYISLISGLIRFRVTTNFTWLNCYFQLFCLIRNVSQIRLYEVFSVSKTVYCLFIPTRAVCMTTFWNRKFIIILLFMIHLWI